MLENSILYPRLHTSHMIPPCYILEFHQFGLPWQQQDLINSFDELVTVKFHGLPTNYDDRPKMRMSINGKWWNEQLMKLALLYRPIVWYIWWHRLGISTILGLVLICVMWNPQIGLHPALVIWRSRPMPTSDMTKHNFPYTINSHSYQICPNKH